MSFQQSPTETHLRYRIACQVLEGIRQITVKLDTICNEPAVLAAVYLTYGNTSVGMINWGTCLLYPEGPSRDTRKGWVANLLPHEYVHSWCGKFRRPAGMCTSDFRTPQKGMLVWLEADAIIREQSGGKKSLDDFCRKFLGANPSTAKSATIRNPTCSLRLSNPWLTRQEFTARKWVLLDPAPHHRNPG